MIEDAFISVFAPSGVPEIAPGDELSGLLGDHLVGILTEGDIVVVTSKIVSKAEGRLRPEHDREQAISDETIRVVATKKHSGGSTRIVQNRLGLVMAAAGVDGSNVPIGSVLLLPIDPDASAAYLCRQWRERFGITLGVIVTDTMGRPWRQGQTDVAIGAAGVVVADDLTGTLDSQGRTLSTTLPAIADEIAGMADLVKGKAMDRPIAVVRGLSRYVVDVESPGASALVRPANSDLFQLGTSEARAQGQFDCEICSSNQTSSKDMHIEDCL